MVAGILGISAPSVYSAIQRRKAGLRHFRTPGGHFKVKRRDILAFCHQNGYEVPAALFEGRPQLVLIHPFSHRLESIRAALGSSYRIRAFCEPIEGLLAVGERRPIAVLLSSRLGEPMIQRLCEALTADEEEIGYTVAVVLHAGRRSWWGGGVVPQPLRLPEPAPGEGELFRRTFDRLLGMG